jgi:hypothetical protein
MFALHACDATPWFSMPLSPDTSAMLTYAEHDAYASDGAPLALP